MAIPQGGRRMHRDKARRKIPRAPEIDLGQ